MRRCLTLILASLCAFAGVLSAQESVSLMVYELPADMPGKMMFLFDSEGGFTTSYNYDPKGESRSCVGWIESPSRGGLSRLGTYRELYDGLSLWGTVNMVFDLADSSCALTWKDEALGTTGAFTMQFLRYGDKLDLAAMEIDMAFVNRYWDDEETLEYLELFGDR